jgi:hypothetical protein
VQTQGSHPAARFAGTLITDSERGRLLLFGGQTDSVARSDVWELVETAVPAAAAARPEASEEASASPIPGMTDEPTEP